MRVITGSARGRKLETLEGLDVRPTGEKVKEAIFSSIQFEIEGANVLDLFAGSGQLGIEALSRGANKCWFCDSSASSVAIVKRNLETTKLSDQAVVSLSDYKTFLSIVNAKFDIVFLDPPYALDVIEEILAALENKVNDGIKIIYEHGTEKQLPKKVGKFKLSKEYKYSKTAVTVYTLEEND